MVHSGQSSNTNGMVMALQTHIPKQISTKQSTRPELLQKCTYNCYNRCHLRHFWYQIFNLYIGPFLDTHVITHFFADIVTHEESEVPSQLEIERHTKPLVLHILCVHHKNTNISTPDQMLQFNENINNL